MAAAVDIVADLVALAAAAVAVVDIVAGFPFVAVAESVAALDHR